MEIIRKNGFVIALLASVGLACIAPGIGATDGILKAGLLSKLGVMVIFLLQGMTLKTGELAKGMRQVKLHAFIQGWIFIVAAIVLVAIGLLLKVTPYPDFSYGFLYLALVPTTISSAVAFTSAAGGNVPVAIFNTTISNAAGVFWVPLGCLLLFATGSMFNADLVLPLLWKVSKLILLPLIVGQLLRPMIKAHPLFIKAAPGFKWINQSIILFIVFATFSDSFVNKAWQGISAVSILLLLILVTAAVIFIHLANWLTSPFVAKNKPERIAALYCGSQKTLAAGAPMAVAIFSGNASAIGLETGIILLPLMCYHPIQLFLAAFILPRISQAD